MADDDAVAKAEQEEKDAANAAIRGEAAAAGKGEGKSDDDDAAAKAEAAKAEEESDDKELGPEGEKALEAFKKRAREAERKVKEYEDAQKTEAEKRDEALAEATKEAEDWKGKYLRLKVGTEKGLPTTLAERLRGEDEKEMADDAERLAAEVKPKGAGDADGGKGDPSDTSWNDKIRAQVAARR